MSESKPGSCRRLGEVCVLCCRLVSRRCHAISPIRRLFPAPRRTGLGVLHHPAPSLSPSRLDSPRTLNSRRYTSKDALRLRACPAAPARQPSETRGLGAHGQSPLSVGPCITLALSQTATPLLRPHYRESTLRMDGSDFRAPPPMSSLLHWFMGARLPRTDTWISLVTAYSQCQARHGLGPRGDRRRSPLRSTGCCLPAGQNRRHSPTKIFGAQHLQGRLHPLPLHLACFRAYASTRLLPACRKARYWARG